MMPADVGGQASMLARPALGQLATGWQPLPPFGFLSELLLGVRCLCFFFFLPNFVLYLGSSPEARCNS